MHDEDEVDENGDLITPDTTQISNQNEDGTTLDKSQEEE